MTRWKLFCFLPLALVPAVAASGCGPEDDPIPVAEPRDERLEGVEGLSREEMERDVEAIPPEEAMERGVLDTTIYLEPLDPEEPDTVPPTLP